MSRILALAAAVAALVFMVQPAPAARVSALESHPAAGSATRYVPLTPSRILDTRPQYNVPNEGYNTPFGQGAIRQVRVASRGGVPSDGTAVAAVINVTVANGTTGSFLTIFPDGQRLPNSSVMNWGPGDVKANLTQVQLGLDGDISVFNDLGSVDVIIDVAGYFTTAPGAAGLYNPVNPTRIIDTRSVYGGPIGPLHTSLGPGQYALVRLEGLGPVPPSGVSAVVVNVTVTDTSAASYLQLWPADQPRPNSSNLNWFYGQTVANRTTVMLSRSDGSISLYNPQGYVDVIIDVDGWYTDGSVTTAGHGMVSLPPTRILDTRPQYQVGPYSAPMGNGEIRNFQVSGQGGVPFMTDPAPPVAVVVNLTVTDTAGDSYVSAFPYGSSVPNVSDVNWSPGETTSNLAVVMLGANGAVKLYNSEWCTDVVVDVVGYYTGPAVAGPPGPVAPSVPSTCSLPTPPPPPKGPIPTRLRVPSIAIDANVEQVGTDAGGNVGSPGNIWDVGWFNPGPAPGDPGDAIMDGHVDWYNSPTAVFTNLAWVPIGAAVYVDRADGSTVRFLVDSVGYYPVGSPPGWLFSHSGPAQLSLITCSGYWDGYQYTQRLVVHTHEG